MHLSSTARLSAPLVRLETRHLLARAGLTAASKGIAIVQHSCPSQPLYPSTAAGKLLQPTPQVTRLRRRLSRSKP